MNNKIIITKEEKDEIKARLYYTYSFFDYGIDFDKYDLEINAKYKSFIQQSNLSACDRIDLRLIKFEIENRLLLAIITLLCEMYEQYLGGILISNLNITKGLDFGKIKSIYQEYGYDLSSNSHWKKIEELRILVNVIKHGDGHSRRILQEKRPDYIDHTEPIKNTLNDVELNVWKGDLDNYFLELIKFIEEMPETIYMTSK